MRDRLDLHVLRERFDRAKGAVPRFKAIWDPEGSFQVKTKHRQIRQKQSTEIDQDTLSFRMRQALDFGKAQNRIAERSINRAAHWTIFGDKSSVLHPQLNLLSQLVKNKRRLAGHCGCVEPALAQAGIDRQ